MLRRVAVSVLVIAVVAGAGRLAMPFAARWLIHSDPLAHADAIVVLGAMRLERTFEAGTLYREGWSRRIILLRPPDIASEGVLARVNVEVPLWIDIQKSALLQMSVPAAAIVPAPYIADTTRQEAEFTADYVRRAGFKRIIVVTSPYHTARAGRFFRNAAGGSFVVIMRPDRYERIDPDHWWRHALDRSDV